MRKATTWHATRAALSLPALKGGVSRAKTDKLLNPDNWLHVARVMQRCGFVVAEFALDEMLKTPVLTDADAKIDKLIPGTHQHEARSFA